MRSDCWITEEKVPPVLDSEGLYTCGISFGAGALLGAARWSTLADETPCRPRDIFSAGQGQKGLMRHKAEADAARD